MSTITIHFNKVSIQMEQAEALKLLHILEVELADLRLPQIVKLVEVRRLK